MVTGQSSKNRDSAPSHQTTTGMAPSYPPDELTTTVYDALHSLSQSNKASFLLDTALSLIQVGRYVGTLFEDLYLTREFSYGPDVENYLEVYLKTPGLPKADIARALLARGNARKSGGEALLAKAQQGMLKLYLYFPL